jgi:uncharacterized membrane protein (UPF0127 family)
VARLGAARAGAAAFAVVALALLVVGIVKLTDDGGGGSPAAASGSASRASLVRALDAATPARPPFSGLTQTRIRVGNKVMKVVVADSDSERETGLRQRRDAGPHDGMLFVFPSDTGTAFTMSTVPVSLDIGFYGASGGVVDRLLMKPCAGTDATCPRYVAKGSFRYALETTAGRLPRGALSGATG